LPALGLSIAIGAWAEAILLLIVLKRREPALDVRGILSVGLRALIGAAVAAGVALAVGPWGLAPFAEGKLAAFAIAGLATLAGGLAYLAVAFALRIPELPTMISIVTSVVRRRSRS
jgi:peptidoglycan biosynthesis protein MviN/MurJ (putative lipid II flippase)